MPNTITGATAPVLTTTCVFHSPAAASVALLQVRPGMPAHEALQAASLILSAALGVAEHYCDNPPENPNAMFAPVYLIEMGKALIDSIDLPEEAQEGGAA